MKLITLSIAMIVAVPVMSRQAMHTQPIVRMSPSPGEQKDVAAEHPENGGGVLIRLSQIRLNDPIQLAWMVKQMES